jgi:transposase
VAPAQGLAALGHWKTVYTRCRRWPQAGVWERLFKALAQDPDCEYVLVDATISKVHADTTSHRGGLRLTPSAAPAAG